MNSLTQGYVIFCALTINFPNAVNGKLYIKRETLCSGSNSLIKYVRNITTENGVQYLTQNITTPIPWGDNLGVYAKIEVVHGRIYTEIFHVNDKNLCKTADKFLGEMWHNMEKASKMPVGVCPIPAGTYNLNHFKLNFDQLAINIPIGSLRITIKGIDNNNKKADVICWLLEVEG